MANKKKILFITNIPSPYRINFYNELGKYFELTVIFEAKGASDQGIRFNWNYNEIKNFKAIFLSDGDIKENKVNWSIFKHIKKNLFDEIVVTSYSYFTEMAALIYLKMMNIPYYMETDGGIIRKEIRIKKLYKTFLISGAKGYFSPSLVSDAYLVYYGADSSKINRYSFTSLKNEDILKRPITATQKREHKNKLGIKEEQMVLGVGQFINRKGFDILIEASKGIKENIGIYIVGGEVTEEYKQLKSKSKLEHVHFVGFKSKGDLSDYYKAADLFVLPTREDIWGLVINEAMAYGLPIITTDKCGAGLELIQNGENGYILETKDEKQEIIKLRLLLSKIEELNGMGTKSLSTISKYTIENMAIEHCKVFKC